MMVQAGTLPFLTEDIFVNFSAFLMSFMSGTSLVLVAFRFGDVYHENAFQRVVDNFLVVYWHVRIVEFRVNS
jgi:hypothetical protein